MIKFWLFLALSSSLALAAQAQVQLRDYLNAVASLKSKDALALTAKGKESITQSSIEFYRANPDKVSLAKKAQILDCQEKALQATCRVKFKRVLTFSLRKENGKFKVADMK